MKVKTSEELGELNTKRLFGIYTTMFSNLQNKTDSKNRKAHEFQLEEVVNALKERFQQNTHEIRQLYVIITNQVEFAKNSKYQARTEFWQAVKDHFYSHILG
jgi:hypothetical protein